MQPNAAYRRYCHVCWYCGRCWRFGLAGSFRSATNWGGILGVGLLGWLLSQYGHTLMPAGNWYEAVAQGLIYIAAAWVVIFLVRTVLIAPFAIHQDGEWHGTRFVYREPKLAFHRLVSPADNNHAFPFRFPDAPPFHLLNYKIELDGRQDLISACVMAHPNQFPLFQSHEELRYGSGSIAVNKQRDMYLRVFMRHDALPFSVRIYVTGWDTAQPKNPPPPPKSDPAPPSYYG